MTGERKSPVFLSVGRTATLSQEEFVKQLEERFDLVGLEPETVGRTRFTAQAPLQEIRRLMQECQGVAVVAFERIQAPVSIEFRGGASEAEHRDFKWPTVWNQIEAAIGYAMGKPLLVIVERGVRMEGLLEGRYDWFVAEVDLKCEWFDSPEFKGIFDDWRARVQETTVNPLVVNNALPSSGEVSIGKIISSMTAAQVWAAGTAIVGLLSAVAGFAYKVGQSGIWP